MSLTANYDAILREKQEYDAENNIDPSENPFMGETENSSMGESYKRNNVKVKAKPVPKKILKKPVAKPLIPQTTLPEEPKPPMTAAGTISGAADSKEFIKEFTPIVEYHSKRLGLSPNLVLAQIALETGWGKDAPGFNFGGQKVGSDWKGKTQTFSTKEFVPGLGLQTKEGEQFRSYNTAQEGIKGYFDFLKSYKRYQPIFGVADPKQGADILQKAGYATDPKYSKKLKQVIDTVQRIRKESNI